MRPKLDLAPRSVAVIGASERVGGIGNRVTRHVLDGPFAGEIYLINPRYERLHGRHCFTSLAEIGIAPDICVLLVPSESVLDELANCAAAGAKAVIVVAAGHEVDNYPEWLESVGAFARASGVRVYGPNTVGLVLANCGLWAGFPPMLETDGWQGGGAFVTQSGGMTAPFHECAIQAGLGVRYMVGTGSEADATVCDILDTTLDDDQVEYAVAFVEGCGDAWRLAALSDRSVERGAPLFLLKGGRSAKGRLASLSHTGRSSSGAHIYKDICRDLGIGWLDDENALRIALQVLPVAHRLPPRPRLGCITSSGGIATLIADHCEDFGIRLSEFSDDTRASLAFLKKWGGSDNNPVDASAQLLARSDFFDAICGAVAAENNVDVVLVSATARLLDYYADQIRDLAKIKPVVFTSVGAGPNAGMRRRLAQWGVACFPNAVDAVRGLALVSPFAAARRVRKRVALSPPRPAAETHWLSPRQGMEALSGSGVPVVPRAVVKSIGDTAGLGGSLGYPMVLKIDSAEVPHKAAVGGLVTNINDEAGLRDAYIGLEEAAISLRLTAFDIVAEAQLPIRLEVAVSIFNDPEFGPLLMVARGGSVVETTADRVYGGLRHDRDSALELLSRSPIAEMLDGIDPSSLADCIASACTMFSADHSLREVEINPVAILDSSGRSAILDALVSTTS